MLYECLKKNVHTYFFASFVGNSFLKPNCDVKKKGFFPKKLSTPILINFSNIFDTIIDNDIGR